jgi:hypothetical protein
LPEPSNPHDPHAIVVRIGGFLVGYLSRHDARDFGSTFAHLQNGKGLKLS